MQLTYRGTRYSLSAPAVESETLEIEGRYRGIAVKIATPSTTPQATLTLSYRGVTY